MTATIFQGSSGLLSGDTLIGLMGKFAVLPECW